MAEIKTRPTGEDVTAFLDAAEPERRRTEGHALRELMERVTGQPATMWGPTMVGFGAEPYTNTMGTNDWFIVGFSPRKPAISLYGIYTAYGPPDPLIEKLGPHTAGKGCVYVKRLEAIDMDVLEQLVARAWVRRTP
jgi:Domain of unknown function (DU1801)